MKSKFTCPVCGYPELWESPRTKSGGGSYEICPSCGFEFGVDDDDKGITYEEWRKKWKADGCKWQSKNPSLKGWNGLKQLQAFLKGTPGKKESGR